MLFSRLLAFVLASVFIAPGIFAQTFHRTNYPTGNSPAAVVSADINRDGHPDLISADHSGFITILLGTSSGTFINSGNLRTASPPVALVAGDFNSDGFPDIVVLEESAYQLFLSAHNGSLVPQAAVSIPGSGTNIVAIDLNGNHIPDLALTVCTNFQQSCTLETLLNNGSGHFTVAQTRAIGANTFNSLVAADFDRDSHDDIAVGAGNSVLILHSNNNGTLSLRQTISPTGTQVFALAAGDIDAKNGPDLVFAVTPNCFPDCIQNIFAFQYLNNGFGTLGQKTLLDTKSDSLFAFRFSDITGDNRLDLIAVSTALQENNGFLSWAHNLGGGNLSAFAPLVQLSDPVDLIARDFNLDSRHDLAVADRGSAGTPATVVFLNTSFNPICPGLGSANLAAKICSPSTTPGSDTVTVRAAGNSPTGVRRAELWVDGRKLYNSPDDRLLTVVTLTRGTHKVQVVAVDQFGATATATRFVTAP